MTGEELKLFFSQPLVLLALMVAGSLASAWKQMITARREGHFTTMTAYWAQNWPETLTTIGGVLVAFIGLVMTDALNWAAALGGGWIANSAADLVTKDGRSKSLAAAAGTKADPVSMKNPEGGFARVPMLLLIASLAVAVPVVATMPGCSSTQTAYKAAAAHEDPTQLAFVLVNHWTLLVEEAARLKNLPTTPDDVVEKMREADRIGTPIAQRADELRKKYEAIPNATNEAELQAAINDLLREIAKMVGEQARAKGGTP